MDSRQNLSANEVWRNLEKIEYFDNLDVDVDMDVVVDVDVVVNRQTSFLLRIGSICK